MIKSYMLLIRSFSKDNNYKLYELSAKMRGGFEIGLFGMGMDCLLMLWIFVYMLSLVCSVQNII